METIKFIKTKIKEITKRFLSNSYIFCWMFSQTAEEQKIEIGKNAGQLKTMCMHLSASMTKKKLQKKKKKANEK
jgi:uncharacterized membrane protein YkgB